MYRFLVPAIALAALASPATAAVVYSNNFDTENGGNTALNYNGFNGLTVTAGTVDLVRSGDFGITCAGGTGSCVDLDGSTNNAGLASSNSFAFNAGDRVALSLLFSGNQRNVQPNDSFTIRFSFAGATTGIYGSESTTFGSNIFGTFDDTSVGVNITNIPPGFAMTDYTFYFIADNAGSVNFAFQDGGNDNVGVIIDNLSLDIAAVPEPSTWAMLILGFGAIGATLRRRRGVGAPVFA